MIDPTSTPLRSGFKRISQTVETSPKQDTPVSKKGKSSENKDMEIDLASESDSLLITDSTPKSKCGRPPSLSSDVDLPSDTDLTVPSIDSTPKNKGGRPPKPKMGFRGTRSKSAVPTIQVDQQATEFEIVVSHEIEDESGNVNLMLPPANTNVPKKRGRPSKSVDSVPAKPKERTRPLSERIANKEEQLRVAREKAMREEIEEWRASLPKNDLELIKICNEYLIRHPQPTAKPFPLKLPMDYYLGCHRSSTATYKCASKEARHSAPYYDSGDFSYLCPKCRAKLLKREFELLCHKCWAKCCAYGDVDTKLMREEYQVGVCE